MQQEIYTCLQQDRNLQSVQLRGDEGATRLYKFCCRDHILVFCTSALITKNSQISSSLQVDDFFCIFFMYVFFLTVLLLSCFRNVINTPTLRRISCCVLTWAHSDIIQRFYLGVGRRNSGECPQQLTFLFSHPAFPDNLRRISGVQCLSVWKLL